MSAELVRDKTTHTRRARIVDLIRERSEVPVSELLALFDVSSETIRRDLRFLENQKTIVRSYGMVHAVQSGSFETALTFRQTNQADEKARIAREAASRVGSASTVFVDEGFLPSLVAAALPRDVPLTIVTASVPAVMNLAQHDLATILLLGGRVRHKTLGVVDHWATDMLRTLAIDLAFIGANGLTTDGWLSTPDPAVAAVKAQAVHSATRRILVSGHYKFGMETFVHFANVSSFEAIITGVELSQAASRVFGSLGPTLVRV
jgi:DeoR/GlpR family transcriptional regulator of sugar metabolism